MQHNIIIMTGSVYRWANIYMEHLLEFR